MIELGYKISSEEHEPKDLVEYARRAEQVGFTFGSISDHIHPWIDRQGESPFVWSLLGAISQVTTKLRLITGVTCPTVRVHPLIIAHAAATTAALLPGRFALGLGSGENLNEHVHGDHWPSADVRLEMLEEAVSVIRSAWEGSLFSHRGRHYTVENARLYTLPEEPPPILLAGSGTKSVKLAGRISDGFVGLAPDPEMVATFEGAGGKGKPRYSEVTVCWAADAAAARRTVHEWWPVAGLQGQLMQELGLPSFFEQAVAPLTEEQVTENVVCGPDPDEHIESIRTYAKAGYDHIWIHQVGPDQAGFFDFYEKSVIPKL